MSDPQLSPNKRLMFKFLEIKLGTKEILQNAFLLTFCWCLCVSLSQPNPCVPSWTNNWAPSPKIVHSFCRLLVFPLFHQKAETITQDLSEQWPQNMRNLQPLHSCLWTEEKVPLFGAQRYLLSSGENAQLRTHRFLSNNPSGDGWIWNLNLESTAEFQ